MPTLLTTSKMHPALAARIEASLRTNRRGPGAAAFAPRWVSMFRVVIIVTAGLVVSGIVSMQRKDRAELERTRAQIVDAVRAQSAALTESDKTAVTRVEASLIRFAGAYEGDLVAEELHGANAARTLARPAVYVRGPIGSFARTGRIAEGASTSYKDALLSCLLDPPAARTEKALMKKVRAAYAGGATFDAETANVRRLQDAEVGLPLLLPAWEAAVLAAKDEKKLARLRAELDKVPLAGSVRALKSELLIVALDEPQASVGPTELDGENAHDVRLAIFDIASGKALLRQRMHVDPSGITVALRAEYASGLDGCGLAYDVRDHMSR